MAKLGSPAIKAGKTLALSEYASKYLKIGSKFTSIPQPYS